MPMPPIPLLVPMIERNTGEASHSAMLVSASSSVVSPKAAVLLGNRQPEQTHAPHLGHDVGGNFVRLGNFALARNEFLAHQARDGVEKNLEGGGVADHDKLF